MLKGQKKHIDKEQGKTKYAAPGSVNYRATQNKNNIGTTVNSINYVRFKGLSLYKLHPESRYNSYILTTKIHKKFGSYNSFLTQSMHLSENTKSIRSL